MIIVKVRAATGKSRASIGNTNNELVCESEFNLVITVRGGNESERWN